MKANFDKIYNENTPENYFKMYYDLSYHLIKNCSKALKKELLLVRKRNPLILDLCCGYGTLELELKTNFELSNYNFAIFKESYLYNSKSPLNLSKTNYIFIGVDKAENAVNYALKTKLIDIGITIDIENERVPIKFDEIDILTCFGGIGYITLTGVQNIMKSANSINTFIFTCLESVDCIPIIEYLESNNYSLKKYKKPIIQRNAIDISELIWFDEVTNNKFINFRKKNELSIYANLYIAKKIK